IALATPGFREGKETGEVEFAVIQRNGQAARLERAPAIRVVGNAVAQIHMANDSPCAGIDDGDGVLGAVGNKNSKPVRRGDDVPWLRASSESAHNVGGESAPGWIADLDDR